MPGYLLYILLGFGLGALVPGPGRIGFSSPGLRLFLGIGLAPIAVFVLHKNMGLGLFHSVSVIFAAAAAGLALGVWRLARNRPSLEDTFNPAFVLPAVIGIVALNFGALDYVPYLGDEFSGWINIAKQINAVGGYAPEDMFGLQADYTPGWPLLMSFPALLLGQFEERMVGLLPAGMHAGLLGLVFDLAGRTLINFGDFSAARRAVYSWLIVLLLLSAEATGQLVARNLLVEPPQIYGIGVTMMLAVAMFLPGVSQSWASFLIGLSFAILYFIKVTALALLPPILFLAVILPFAERFFAGSLAPARGSVNWIAQSIKNLAAALLPGVLLIVLFKSSISSSTPFGSPSSVLLPEMFAKAFSLQSLEITRLVGGAVWDFTATYKTPVSIAALIGLIAAAFNPRWRLVIAVLLAFLLVYFAALNWYHLTIWDDNLRSIQRYSRIPVRVFHLIGLMLLFVNVAELVLGRESSRLKHFLESRLPFVLAIGLVVVLAVWQVRQIDRRIADLSTRQFQHVAAFHTSVPKAAKQMGQILRQLGDRKVNLLVVQQGGNPDILEVVHYYLVSNSYRSGIPNIQFHAVVSWPLASSSNPSAAERLDKAMTKADVIWPVRLDEAMSRRLRELTGPGKCAQPMADNFFLSDHGNPPQLRCVTKTD